MSCRTLTWRNVKEFESICSILCCSFRIIFIPMVCVLVTGQAPLQIILGLYKANREISNIRIVYKFCLPIRLLACVHERPHRQDRVVNRILIGYNICLRNSRERRWIIRIHKIGLNIRKYSCVVNNEFELCKFPCMHLTCFWLV